MTLRDLVRLQTRAQLVRVVYKYAAWCMGVVPLCDASTRSQRCLSSASTPCWVTATPDCRRVTLGSGRRAKEEASHDRRRGEGSLREGWLDDTRRSIRGARRPSRQVRHPHRRGGSGGRDRLRAARRGTRYEGLRTPGTDPRAGGGAARQVRGTGRNLGSDSGQGANGAPRSGRGSLRHLRWYQSPRAPYSLTYAERVVLRRWPPPKISGGFVPQCNTQVTKRPE